MIYLASRSPQRATLLHRAQIPFEVVDTTCDEESITHVHPQVLALERARAKAHGAVLSPVQLAQSPVVVAADTVVALGGTIFGKPSDRNDAIRILTRLQGTSHSVYTGHACLRFASDGSVQCEAARIAVAHIVMHPMSADEIAAYVASGESDGRAGAYAIQETGDRFVAELQGSWDTVVGLTICMVARLYHECMGHKLPGYQE